MDYNRSIIGPSFQLLSNWCSMGCAGCGIRVSPPPGADVVTLGKSHVANARQNLHLIKDTIDDMGFEYGLVEQSGGEPTHHPQIVEAVGEVFHDSIHKIITNGLTSRSIYDYSIKRRNKVVLVISIDHHEIAFNRIRLGSMHKSNPGRALQIHSRVLENLHLFVTSNIPVVVPTIISRWNIGQYFEFIAWLEERYPNQIEDGLLVPVPVSLVSFGNANLGKLNPSEEQISVFEQAIQSSELLTVRRGKEWLFKQLAQHYRNKNRFFSGGESFEDIKSRPSRYSCEIFRYMISFNFQDEEILRIPEDALFQGYSCGVKLLGNIGYSLGESSKESTSIFDNRPSNMRPDHKYYRTDQIREYINRKDAVNNDEEFVKMGGKEGYFSDLRNGMCILDDFDGVWWPFNVYLQGIVDGKTIGEYWSLFRDNEFLKTLQPVREAQKRISSDAVAFPLAKVCQ